MTEQLQQQKNVTRNEGRHGNITVGTHVNRATGIRPRALGRFVACYADSATENAKLLLPNDVRVTFIENPHPGPRASPEKRVTRVTLA
eukprot:scaffold21956_cov63-Phaeocystis_antarctica.AAC.1